MASALLASLSSVAVVSAVFNSLAVPAPEGLLLHGHAVVGTRIESVCREGATAEDDTLGLAPQLVVFLCLERVPGGIRPRVWLQLEHRERGQPLS